MRVELDEDATRVCEKLAGQVGMSVASFANWVLASLAEVNLTEAGTVRLDPKEPLEKVQPRIIRYRKNWIAKF